MTSDPGDGDLDSPVSGGNRLTLFDDGEALFERVTGAMRAAKARVWVETFILTPDETGRTTLTLMAEAARRGCDVVLLFDQLGSHVTNLGLYKPLEEAGGVVAVFNPLRPWQRLGRPLGSWVRQRNHRKTIVVDDVAFCGGHNVSRAYMGRPPHHFYDMTVMIEGPVVRDAGRLFLDSLERTTRARRPVPDAPQALPDGVRAQVLGHDGRRRPSPLVRAYTELVERARERITLIMAYFVPDARLREPLLAAATRGVDVRLLTAGATDVPPARWAGEHVYGELLAAGVRIWQLQQPALHAKAIALEGVDLQLEKCAARPVEQHGIVGDALQEERIRPVDDRHVDLAVRLQRLEVRDQIAVGLERFRNALEQHADIHIAPGVRAAGDRRPELQDQPDTVPPRDLLEPLQLHARIIRRSPRRNDSGLGLGMGMGMGMGIQDEG